MIFLLVGAVVAVAAAARSTWSPCGLSMLSTITPFGERARRHRYGVTAAWFMVGAVLGGATLGGVGAGLAALVGGAAPGRPVVLGIAAAVAVAGAMVDAGVFGPVLPLIRRQVDDRWLGRYRPWVYGVGFGWQIGVGFATYLMTAGVVAVTLFGGLSGSVGVAFGLGVLFGAARGSTVFLTARAGTPAGLRALHVRLERVGPAVRRAAAGVQAGAAVALGVAAGGLITRSGLAGAALAALIAAAMGIAFPLVAAVGPGERAREHRDGRPLGTAAPAAGGR